jgi:hypothetical protein
LAGDSTERQRLSDRLGGGDNLRAVHGQRGHIGENPRRGTTVHCGGRRMRVTQTYRESARGAQQPATVTLWAAGRGQQLQLPAAELPRTCFSRSRNQSGVQGGVAHQRSRYGIRLPVSAETPLP